MKNAFATVFAGLVLCGASLPAVADSSGCMTLKNDETVKGTFQGYHMGQILMKTDAGQEIELPSMAIFWGTEPRIQQADLKVGQPLTITLPAHSQFYTYKDVGDRSVVGSYDGVARLPQSTVSAWARDDMEAANR